MKRILNRNDIVASRSLLFPHAKFSDPEIPLACAPPPFITQAALL
jgi:hypothetical protein